MQNETVTALQMQQITWQTENVPAGTYFYQIEMGGKVVNGKIIKE